jgi:hypothetical protein
MPTAFGLRTMIHLERSDTLKSIYDLENPRRHKSVKQILCEAGATPMNDDYEIADRGTGYASIVPTESPDEE